MREPTALLVTLRSGMIEGEVAGCTGFSVSLTQRLEDVLGNADGDEAADSDRIAVVDALDSSPLDWRTVIRMPRETRYF